MNFKTAATVHGGHTADPTAADNAGAGFHEGDLWINESTDATFILADAAAGTWREATSFEQLQAHTANTNNPHTVTKAQVGLPKLDNVEWLDLGSGSIASGVDPAHVDLVGNQQNNLMLAKPAPPYDGYQYNQLAGVSCLGLQGGRRGTINLSGTSNVAAGVVDIGYIQANGLGTLAHGGGTDWNRGSVVTTSATGSHAHGKGQGGSVQASGTGAHAHGYAHSYGQVEASAIGAHAHGIGGYTTRLTASGTGALAMGYANTGDIVASATGAVQIGVGTNDQADSLQVKDQLHLLSAAPATPANGDIWQANGYVYIQSGGNSVKVV